MILDPLELWMQLFRQSNRVADQEMHEVDPVQRAPAKMAGKRVFRGRSINFALTGDGHWHLRRRARQVKRDFGSALHWRAFPANDIPTVRPRKRPWWWIL